MSNFRRRAIGRPVVAMMAALCAVGVAEAQVVIVEKAMPAPIYERAPPPRAGYGWVPGHWKWNGARWFWAKGHPVRGVIKPMPAALVETQPPRPSPKHFWVRGHWGWAGADWRWRPGAWFYR